MKTAFDIGVDNWCNVLHGALVSAKLVEAYREDAHTRPTRKIPL
jgi:hypothetical protein